MKTSRLPRLALSLSSALMLSLLPALASAQIKQPGAHPKYSVELEPHFIIDWEDHDWGNDEAVGVGLRATIPFLDNGPISKINNNMGIGFGLDWAHNGDACDNWWRGWWWGPKNAAYYRGDCTVDVFHLPIVVQWNFWLTPIISVFGEAGLEIQRWHIELDDCPPGWDCDDSDTDVNPVFWGGGRFLFGEHSTVGGVVRLGWPYLSLGIGILI